MKHIFTSLALGMIALLCIVKIIDARTDQPVANLDWYIQVVHQFDQSGSISNRSLQLDHYGYPHIAFANGGNVYHTWNDGTAWHFETIAVDGNAENPVLALDRSDKPHIAYESNGGIKYVYWAGGGWIIQTVDAQGSHPSLALDTTDQPHLSYDFNNQIGLPSGYAYAAKYAVRVGSTWHIQTLEQGINPNSIVTTLGTSIALDSHEYPHIVYTLNNLLETTPSYVHQFVKYTHWTGHAWNTQTIFQNDFETTPPNTVWSPDIALDGTNFPHFIYNLTRRYPQFQDDLKFACWIDNIWQGCTLDDAPEMSVASLALDANGNNNVSWSSNEGRLQFAYDNGYRLMTWELVANDFDRCNFINTRCSG